MNQNLYNNLTKISKIELLKKVQIIYTEWNFLNL